MDWDTFWQLVIAVVVLQVVLFVGSRLLLGLVLVQVNRRLVALEDAVASLTLQVTDLIERVTALEGEEPPGPPPFVVGETYPDETNVGAGIIAPYPTKIVNGVTVYNGPGETIRDTVFNDLVQVRADGYTFINCAFRGPAVHTSGGQLVWVDQVRVTPAGRPVFQYCDINPQTASSFWNGIGWKLYKLEQCHIWGTTDCLAVFARSDDPDPRVYVEVLGCWLEKLSQFKPDVAGNRDITHNDCVQFQGNTGPANDAFFDGCRVDAYASVEQSSPTPPEHISLAAFMLTPNQHPGVCVTIQRSWMSGGVQTLNASASSNGKSILVLKDNIYEKPRSGGPSAAIAINRVLTNLTISGQVYTDGTPVQVYYTG